ncbi:MAG: hypothetical protein ACOYM3_04835 [Terrimicrobiaceae bacterium]
MMPTPGSILGAIIFGAIGMGAFVHGKRNGLVKPMLIGVALMGYPYFIADGFLVFVIGAALCFLLYFFKE